ncbi:RuBisCO accumulation factor 1 [Prochlorothrix hollandica]|uniref:RuBisCO accumulation factor 1 n=1 Tax=Prochlorothrix hollandica PCC 9006 = CALU 1027 TaxID=317619 RepID=A0A0M2Q1U0_PROHO|nr:RuBisCO accumulation factor 1 [Prochlorothrix hollandica]KKJ00924.1 hypothetical protein PROH_00270 [Prochlorothrix hollandica PCC 9006 = CALU 1027]
MTQSTSGFQPPPSSLSDTDTQALLLMLRRKEQNWVEWGKACQVLQRAGHSAQDIFEGTGFEPVQQNQIIVAAQVYDSLVKGEASADLLDHFQGRGSDVLYELRRLSQEQRVQAAALVLHHRLEFDEAKELAKAYQEFTRMRIPPEGFEANPGDALAHYCWRLARSRTDLQERSRLIAKGLRFSTSPTARQKLEQLLTDFTVVALRSAPTMPFYRLEQEEDLPRVIPVVGTLPLQAADLQTGVPLERSTGLFQVLRSPEAGAWIALPGWQSIVAAIDPVAVQCHSATLPKPPPGTPETVMVLIDLAQQDWDGESYYACEAEGMVQFSWFAESPSEPLLGRVVVVVRPARILDEDAITMPWQLDE